MKALHSQKIYTSGGGKPKLPLVYKKFYLTPVEWESKVQISKAYLMKPSLDEATAENLCNKARQRFAMCNEFGAWQTMEEGLRLNPWSENLHRLKGQLLKAAGKYREAEQAEQKALLLKRYNNLNLRRKRKVADPLMSPDFFIPETVSGYFETIAPVNGTGFLR